MTLKLYSRLYRDKLRYEFELNSCIGDYAANTIIELVNNISEGNVRIYQGKQTIYEYFLTRSEVDSIAFLAEYKFRDIYDMCYNLKTVLYKDYPELFL